MYSEHLAQCTQERGALCSFAQPHVHNSVGLRARVYRFGVGCHDQANDAAPWQALKEFGVWDEVDAYCTTVVGRMDWAPGAGPDEGVENIFKGRPYLTKVIARDRLVGVLDRIVRERYSTQVTLHRATACTNVRWLGEGGDEVELTVQPTRAWDSEVETGTATRERPALLIAADGAARTVADCLEEAERERRGR